METDGEKLFTRGLERLVSLSNNLILLATSEKHATSTMYGNTLISIQPYDIWGQLTKKWSGAVIVFIY